MLQRVMVEVPQKIFEQIGIKDENSKSWDSAKEFGLLKVGTKVTKAANLFPRVEVKKEINNMQEENKKVEEKQETKVNEKGYITIDELGKVDLRVAQIINIERVEKADKLYKLTIDLGNETRTIVSGLVPFYKEEELLNKQIVVVANLKPAKLRGIMSEGMLLAAGETDVVKLLVLDNNNGKIENGTKIH